MYPVAAKSPLPRRAPVRSFVGAASETRPSSAQPADGPLASRAVQTDGVPILRRGEVSDPPVFRAPHPRSTPNPRPPQQPNGAPDPPVFRSYAPSCVGALPQPPRGRLRLEFSTVHAAKGREAAHYVVVLDLRDARRGFPSQHQEDPLLSLVLPPPPGGAYRHDEERRLFYVALTRARRGTYLVADSRRPSAFVNELLRRHTGLRRLGEFRRDRTHQMPALPHGNPRRVEHGADHDLPERSLLPLSRAPLSALPARLPGHLRPLVPLHQPLVQRQAAGLPVVPRRRHGHPQSRPGSFLGCTQYASDHPCTNTHRLPKRP